MLSAVDGSALVGGIADKQAQFLYAFQLPGNAGETGEKEIADGEACRFCRAQDAVDMVNQYLLSVIYDVMCRHLILPGKLRVRRVGHRQNP
jgi:hypothetical protein